jgi:hypothetical protein
MPSGIGNEVVAVDDIEEEVSQAASPRVEAKLERFSRILNREDFRETA